VGLLSLKAETVSFSPRQAGKLKQIPSTLFTIPPSKVITSQNGSLHKLSIVILYFTALMQQSQVFFAIQPNLSAEVAQAKASG